MRKTTVVRLRGAKFIDAVSQNNTLLIMLLAILLGVILGALKIKNGSTDAIATVAQSFNEYILSRQNANLFKIFIKAVFVWLPYITAAFLCGTSLAGMATVPLISGYFGYTYGILSAYLYSTFSIQGIGFCMLIIIPSRVITAFALMLACRESFAFSLMMAKLTLHTKNGSYTYFDFKNYCLRYLFILLLMIASTLIDCLFFKAFGRFFNF